MGQVIVVGSINVDHRVVVEHFPAPGETILSTVHGIGAGGKGANQAVAARRAGARSRLLGAVGNDRDGRHMLAVLDDAGVERDGVTVVDGPATGAAYVLVNAEGENSIVVAPGANHHLAEQHVIAALGRIPRGTPVLFQLEIAEQTVLRAMAAASAAGGVVLLNAAPAPRSIDGLLEFVDVLLVNEGELNAIAEAAGIRPDHEPVRLAEDLVQRLGIVVVCTLGSRGAFAVTAEGVFEQRAPRVDVVDTTGAGDTFAGYLAAALAEETPMYRAIERAVAAASLTVAQPGALESIPHAAQLEAIASS
jgi:ribokinase